MGQAKRRFAEGAITGRICLDLLSMAPGLRLDKATFGQPWALNRANRITVLGARTSAAERVYPAIDVHDLPGRGRDPGGDQAHAAARGRLVVARVPAERSPLLLHRLELIEAGNRPGRDCLER